MAHNIYIAGPEVFYANGGKLLAWMRLKSEAYGFGVSLPNDAVLDFTDDLRGNAKAIYDNCQAAMDDSDTIICDLETYRGTEPDGGSVFELGMAFARGIRLYGYTRDRRPLQAKDTSARLIDGRAVDGQGWDYPYAPLPFAPSIMGSTVVLEGDYNTALDRLIVDLENDDRAAGWGSPHERRPLVWTPPRGRRPRVFLSSIDRYAPDADERAAALHHQAEELGLELVLAAAPDLSGDRPVRKATEALAGWLRDLLTCDYLLGDLADFHGWEPSSDVSFECGVAAQLRIPSLGFMPDARRAIDRVPHLGADRDYRDLAGANVENFNFPVNLMFSGYMPVIEGTAETALHEAARRLVGG